MSVCVVTGAAGFIGSHLSEKLLEKGHKVIGVDCFTNYYSEKLKRRNLSGFAKNKNFRLVEKNAADLDFSSFGADYVFHLAAQPGVRASWSSFGEYVKNNILATQHMLESLKGTGIKKVIFASSSSVYGDSKIPMREDYTPKPVSPYGVTKLAAESLCYLYSKNYGLPVVTLRYFTVYGPRQRPDMAFNRFINAVLNGEEITVYGDGNQRRDFTYVEDAAEATMLSMNSKGMWHLINIGGNATHSVNEVIEHIENITGKKAVIEHKEEQKGDVKETRADIKTSKRTIGWSPKTSLKEGLKKQIEWQIANGGI